MDGVAPRSGRRDLGNTFRVFLTSLNVYCKQLTPIYPQLRLTTSCTTDRLERLNDRKHKEFPFRFHIIEKNSTDDGSSLGNSVCTVYLHYGEKKSTLIFAEKQ